MDSLDRVFRLTIGILALAVGCALLPSFARAQEPPGRPDDHPPAAPKGKPDPAAVDAFVTRLMAFDKNKDGKLTRDEITDERLLRTFDRADVNKDGMVTKDELTALATKLLAEDESNGSSRRGFGFPGGPGGPGGPGFGGPGFGGPPRPGQILPNFLQDELHLTAEQRDQIAALQKEVDEKLDKVLTDAQKQQLKEMRQRFGPPGRRGRRGPGGGPGGPGGPSDDRQGDRGRRERGPGGAPPESDR
jgi:EF hand